MQFHQFSRRHFLRIFSLILFGSILFNLYMLFYPTGIAQARNIAASVSHRQFYGTGNTSCVSPPANFDPIKASASDLAYYGLPQPPETSGPIFDRWLNAVQHSKHRECHFTSRHLSTPLNPSNGIEYYGTTPNWSGYVVGNGTQPGFNFVEGEWNVPCPNSSKTYWASSAATWIGIGGYNDNNGNLVQGGTEIDASVPPPYDFYMWYENWPIDNMEIATDKPLACKDHMYALVDYNLTYNDESYIYVNDSSNGYYISEHSYYTPDMRYAEWIDERVTCPLSNTTYTKLADFNYVQWHFAYAMPPGQNSSGIGFFTHTQLTMIEKTDNKPLASPTELFSDGASYNDNWSAAGNDNSC